MGWLNDRWSALDFWDKEENRRQAQARTKRSTAPKQPVVTQRQRDDQPGFQWNNNSLTRGISRGIDTVNPFDRGRSWVTRDISEEQRQQVALGDYFKNNVQSAPKQSLFDRIRDVLDTNTESDQWRRQRQNFVDNKLYGGQNQQEVKITNAPNLFDNTIGAVPRLANDFTDATAGVINVFGLSASVREEQAALRDLEQAKTQEERDAALERLRVASDRREFEQNVSRNINAGIQRYDGGFVGAGNSIGGNLIEQGDTANIAKGVLGNTVEGALDAASLGVAGVTGKALTKGGVKNITTNLVKESPNIIKNAGLNYGAAAGGTVSEAAYRGQDVSLSDVNKAGLLGAGLGTVADVGLGLGYQGAKGVTTSLVNTASDPVTQVKVKAKLSPTNVAGKVQGDKLWNTLDNRVTEAVMNADKSRGDVKLRNNYLEEARELIRLRNDRALEISQGGFIGGGKATGFADTQKAGRVFEGVDGKPRFEVDDSGAKIANPNGKTLGEVLDHPELYKQYPEIANTKVVVDKKLGKNASYSEVENTIRIGNNPETSTVLHELQHNIQNIEGFAKGTVGGQELAESQLKAYKKHESTVAEIDGLIKKIKKLGATSSNPQYRELTSLRKQITKDMAKLKAEMKESLRMIDEYQNSAGEAEARAVASRMNMSDGERYVTSQSPFKDSKVQEPVFHGTKAEFDTFKNEMMGSQTDSGMYGKGFYFTPSKIEAKKYTRGSGNIKEVYLDMKNPYIINSKADIPDIKVPSKTLDDMRNGANNYSEAFTKYLKDKGFDGVIDNMGSQKQHIVFDQSQIKTVDRKSTFYDSLDVPKEDLIIRDGGGRAMSVEQNPVDAINAEAKRFGYDKGYTEEGQIANTVDELMKEQNAIREVGIPLYDKYKGQLDGTKTVTELMTPTELKAYKAAEVKSDKASKLLKDYFDYKKQGKAMSVDSNAKTETKTRTPQAEGLEKTASSPRSDAQTTSRTGDKLALPKSEEKAPSTTRPTSKRGRQHQPQQKAQSQQDYKSPRQVERSAQTTQQSPTAPKQRDTSGLLVSSDGRIANIDEYVTKQVEIQEAKSPKQSRYKTLKRQWIDSLSPAEDNFRQAVKDGKLSQDTLDDIIVKNGKSLRAGTVANLNLVESGLVDLLHKMPKEDYDNLGQTLIARQSLDLKAKGIETGRSPKLDKQILDKYGAKYSKEIEQFRKATDYTLDKAVEHNLISKDTAKLLRKKYPNYVPMNRVIEEIEAKGSFNSGQIASIGRQTVVRSIKGSKKAVQNPIESMIAKIQDMSRQGVRNDAALSWVDALKKTGDAKLIDGDIPPGQSTISVLRNGTKEVYAVDSAMEAAAKGLTKEQMNIAIETARKVTRVFKTGTTGLNLPFTMTNFARDQQTAFLNMSKGEVEVFRAIPKTIMETVGHGELYDEALRQGAISTSFDLTKPDLKLTAKNIRKRGSNLGVLSKIEDVVGRSEEYTRIQQYKATKDYWMKKGLSEDKAITKATLAAQQNSADFARAGDFGRILNAVLPYTNAGVQGTRAYIRGAARNPGKYTLKATATLGMPMVAVALWNYSDENREKIYNDISEFDKQGNFIIVTPWAKKNERGKWEGIVKVPKPPGISALMYPVEKGIGQMKGNDPVAFADITKAVLGFGSPLGDNLKSAVSSATPQVVKPAVETTFNTNLYTGRDIVPFWLQDKPTEEQAYKGTSGTARGVGKIVGTSPINIEHLIKGYGGEVGLQGLNALDNALNKAGVIPEEQIGGRSIPHGFSRRFTEGYDRPGSPIREGASIAQNNVEVGESNVKTNSISITDKTQKNDKGEYTSRDKYDALIHAWKETDGVKKNNPKYDSGELIKAITDVKEESKRFFEQTGLPTDMLDIHNEKFIKDYAKYVKSIEGANSIDQEKKTRTFVKNTYLSTLDDTVQSFYKLGDDDMRTQLQNGTVSKEQMDKVIALDNILTEAGLQPYPQVGKTLRRELGYGQIASSGSSRRSGRRRSSGRRGGRRASFDLAALLKKYNTNSATTSTNKRLRQILEDAVIS